MENLLKEFERIAKAFQAKDQALELDIQKVVNCLRDNKQVPEVDIMDLERAMHGTEPLDWKGTPMPAAKTDFVPNEGQIQFFRDMIAAAREGMEWRVPSTGQIYKVSKADKTFTLIRDTDNEHGDWHGNNRVILEKLGWRMVDTKSSARLYTVRYKNWLLTATDFSIEDQENPATPGKNFDPGSRGQDAFASHLVGGTFIHLGHLVGRSFLEKVARPDFGIGKTVATGLSK